MAKTLYHSQLKALGPTRVTVKSDVLKSKFSKPNAPKPDYVILEINGEDFNYSSENEGCADFFNGSKGKTFTLIAEGGGKGNEATAAITYVGEAADENAEQPVAKPLPVRKGMLPQTKAALHNPAPARAAAPPAARPAGPPGHHGARVGVCLNKAVDYMIAEGIPYNPEELAYRVSDLVRICDALENGHMLPKFSDRNK